MSSLLPRLRRLLLAVFVAGLVWFAATDWVLAQKFNVLAFATGVVFIGSALGSLFFLLRRDIQKREQTHAKNHEVRQTFEMLTQSAPAGIFRANQQGDILFVNNRWSALTGRSQAESQGFGWLLAVHPDDNKRVTEEWRKCVRGEKEFRLDFRLRNKDGSTRWVAGHAMRVLDDREQPAGIIGSILDITERKVADDARLVDQAAALDAALARVQQEASYRKEIGVELERRADELKKRDAELESANRQLWAELSGREQVESELARVRDEVEKLVAERTATLTEVIGGLEKVVSEHELTEKTLRAEKAELEKRTDSAPVELEALRKRLQEEGTRRQLAEDDLRRLREDFEKFQVSAAEPDTALESIHNRLRAELERTGRLEAELASLRTALAAEHEKAERADAERELS
ncbi:MAG: PAS domain S-box protein, partial [Verrucomicrobia bacterium]|nr:PAS domain S-box protein [Verrucomicrobiota bacterium]